MDSELIQMGREVIKRRFLEWKDPPLKLPADSVIDKAVAEIVLLAWMETDNGMDEEQMRQAIRKSMSEQ